MPPAPPHESPHPPLQLPPPPHPHDDFATGAAVVFSVTGGVIDRSGSGVGAIAPGAGRVGVRVSAEVLTESAL
jgi:hypothetical protein